MTHSTDRKLTRRLRLLGLRSHTHFQASQVLNVSPQTVKRDRYEMRRSTYKTHEIYGDVANWYSPKEKYADNDQGTIYQMSVAINILSAIADGYSERAQISLEQGNIKEVLWYNGTAERLRSDIEHLRTTQQRVERS